MVRTDKYFSNIFAGIFEGVGDDSYGFGLRAPQAVTGEFIREWEEDFIIIADSWNMSEREIKRLSIYDFYFRIFTFKKQAEKQKTQLTAPFGNKDW